MLELIDLDQVLPGYRRFISCWVYRSEDVCFLVDPGPRSSAGHLVAALHDLGIDSVDLVLATHIHLDHGGGTADVLAAFPEARFYCHPIGKKHVLDPSRLWDGSLATIGEVAEIYGRPAPVPTDRDADEELLGKFGIQAIPTPGHAPHHVAYLHAGVLFAGEAIATCLQLDEGRVYMRPATPPRFMKDVFTRSLDFLAALSPEPMYTALAHHGRLNGVRQWCRLARAQLERWIDHASHARAKGSVDLDDVIERLLADDPQFGQGAFQSLDSDLQERERFYVKNSLRGMLQSLESPPQD